MLKILLAILSLAIGFVSAYGMGYFSAVSVLRTLSPVESGLRFISFISFMGGFISFIAIMVEGVKNNG